MTGRLADLALDLRLDWLGAGFAVAGLLAGLAQAALLAPPAPPAAVMVDLAPLPLAAASLSALPEPAPQAASAAPVPEPPRPISRPKPAPAPTPAPVPAPEPQPAKQASRPEPAPETKPAPKQQAENAAAPRLSSQSGAKVTAKSWARKVTRQIRATAKERAGKRGRVTVGFTIAADGSLAGATVLTSSGDAGLDAVALNHIRRAAPFAPPPADANPNLAFEFVAR